MTRILYLTILLPVCILRFPAAKAQQLAAYMQNSAFVSLQTDTPYIETYITIPGKTLTYKKNSNGKFEGALEITLMYLRDSNTVAAFDKYVLRSPEIGDTSNISFNLLDLRRVSLPDGDYNVELEVRDANKNENVVKQMQGLNVRFNREKVDFSSIELVDNYSPTTSKNVFSKNGYDIKPYVFNYYPTSANKVRFYCEVYNANKVAGDDDIIITYAVKHAQKDVVANDLFRFSKQKAATVNFVFSEFDITDLPSGNYLVQIQVKSKKNELLGEQNVFLQRSNKNSAGELSNIALVDIHNTFATDLDADSLAFYLQCLYPKAEMYEQDYILNLVQKNDQQLMRQFFYNFWFKRNNADPQGEWIAYKHLVDYVDYMYKTPIDYGFESDRGRVYLQYGAPNRIDGSDREPGAYPYEIWQYYKLSNQSNIHFVFCNSDEVTNDYKLIHSEAIGEIKDPRWKFKIYYTFKDSNGYRNLDIDNFRNTWGSQVDDYFENR